MGGTAIERLRSRARRGFRGYPIATVAFYGPTNEVASKVAVSVVPRRAADAEVLARWHRRDLDVRHDPAIAAAIIALLEVHRPRSVVLTRGVIGCPHEEGVDYPVGTTCPRCPFWAGRDRWREV